MTQPEQTEPVGPPLDDDAIYIERMRDQRRRAEEAQRVVARWVTSPDEAAAIVEKVGFPLAAGYTPNDLAQAVTELRRLWHYLRQVPTKGTMTKATERAEQIAAVAGKLKALLVDDKETATLAALWSRKVIAGHSTGQPLPSLPDMRRYLGEIATVATAATCWIADEVRMPNKNGKRQPSSIDRFISLKVAPVYTVMFGREAGASTLADGKGGGPFVRFTDAVMGDDAPKPDSIRKALALHSKRPAEA